MSCVRLRGSCIETSDILRSDSILEGVAWILERLTPRSLKSLGGDRATYLSFSRDHSYRLPGVGWVLGKLLLCFP